MRKRYFLVALVNSTRGSPLRYSSDLNRAVDKTLNRQGLVVQRDSKLLFSTSRLRFDQSDAEIARLPSQKALRDQESTFEHDVSQQKGKQIRTPWHREGSDLPPVQRLRSAGAMTKGTEVSIIHQRRCCVCTETAYYVTRHSVADLGAGKLLTTPSRLLKLILPLTTLDKNSDRKDVEPLALLVHPQQPLSYLERLIQSELPTIKGPEGKDKIPAVHFRAEDSGQDESDPTAEDAAEKEQKQEAEGDTSGENMEETRFDGKVEKTGKINRKKQQEVASLRGGPGEGGVESYSGRGREADSTEGKERKFVRWSTSTEIGDFIRDAARGKEFAVEIEGTAQEIRVGVPSFNDRTHYLRMRLQKTSRKILDMAAIKKECDTAAHTGAQRIALGGFGVLVAWWYAVYRLTFETDLGWDTMEPVTYLVGLSGLICGYGWFLYHNREVSYRSALNLTISRRQTKLYHAKGFDLHRWGTLVEEGNALRKEIKAIASEYDVDWDETADEQSQTVTEALKQDRDEKKANKEGKDKKDDGNEAN